MIDNKRKRVFEILSPFPVFVIEVVFDQVNRPLIDAYIEQRIDCDHYPPVLTLANSTWSLSARGGSLAGAGVYRQVHSGCLEELIEFSKTWLV